MVFAYLVTLKLRRAEDVPVFLALFAPLCEYCNEREAGTLTYEVLRDESCERTLLILERYRSVEDLEITHRSSAAFQEFCAALGPLDIIEQKTNARYHSALLPSPAPRSDGAAPSYVRRDGCLVFCGSRAGAKPEYVAEAVALGQLLAQRKKTLVYGGGTCGVMGAVSAATHASGGAICSVIPRALFPREVSGESRGELFVTDSMSERKTLMFSLSDTVVCLPGGLGTFDELFEALTLHQLGAITMRIGLVNVSGYFDPLLAMVRQTVNEGFLEPKALNYFVVRNTAAELLATLLDPQFAVSCGATHLSWSK